MFALPDLTSSSSHARGGDRSTRRNPRFSRPSRTSAPTPAARLSRGSTFAGGGLLHDLNPEAAPLQQREQTVEVLEIEQVAGPEDVHQSSPSRLGVFIHALSPTRVAQLEAKLVECWAAAGQWIGSLQPIRAQSGRCSGAECFRMGRCRVHEAKLCLQRSENQLHFPKDGSWRASLRSCHRRIEVLDGFIAPQHVAPQLLWSTS